MNLKLNKHNYDTGKCVKIFSEFFYLSSYEATVMFRIFLAGVMIIFPDLINPSNVSRSVNLTLSTWNFGKIAITEWPNNSKCCNASWTPFSEKYEFFPWANPTLLPSIITFLLTLTVVVDCGFSGALWVWIEVAFCGFPGALWVWIGIVDCGFPGALWAWTEVAVSDFLALGLFLPFGLFLWFDCY